ncbi:MAG: lipoyl(octanoyl) transferase LipB [Sphingomonadaceae bacterium]|uniref:lipoyl(octanoyl) transferase LipB n=1 Tax=Thermaurantiacus sp. TaxID=2820283 RepID=UPI00298EE48B|nr:lipoyl(octanoyl) transferase LipB [Thermaurantiacus sp.]MCS6986883.1 lipoyl(octanoyl) transferase LipB [Sphingomonadaceae bacterium]MDW8415517.1 lipoyl(octanoyl) transferase LipB [Thermaurantiacus sp.]
MHSAETAPLWIVEDAPLPYEPTVQRMTELAEAIAQGAAPERIWLLEHLPVITAGTSAEAGELLDPSAFPVVRTGRGGRYTWHGPGQRVVYVLLNLARRGRDVRRLMAGLEEWAIAALARLGIAAHRSPLGAGVWVATNAGPVKVAAVGLRIRRWVSLHGMAINVAPDMAGFQAIVPCGIRNAGPGRLVDFRPHLTMADLDDALHATCGDFLAFLGGPWGTPGG